MAKLLPKGEDNLLCLSNYYSYHKLSLLLNATLTRYHLHAAIHMAQMANAHQALHYELTAMEQYNCILSHRSLLTLPSIDNRLFLRKKIEHLGSIRERVVPSALIHHIQNTPKILLQHSLPYLKKNVVTPQDLLHNTKQFEEFLSQTAVQALRFHLFSLQLQALHRQKVDSRQLHQLCEMLPYVDERVKIEPT